MSAKVGRNDPCPCGSGKKYKHCHLGKDDDPGHRDVPLTTEEVARAVVASPPMPAWVRYIPWAIAIIGAGASIALFATRGTQEGGAMTGATVLLLVMWSVLGSPPPPKDNAGDPAGLDFGRRN